MARSKPSELESTIPDDAGDDMLLFLRETERSTSLTRSNLWLAFWQASLDQRHIRYARASDNSLQRRVLRDVSHRHTYSTHGTTFDAMWRCGTDSTGSARRPAFVNGIFAIRVSTGLLPDQGMMPCFPLFDTPAVFTRNLTSLDVFLHEWCGPSISSTSVKPTSVILLEDYELPIGNQNDLFWEFVHSLEHCFKFPIRTLSLEKLWASAKPACASGYSLREYLHNVGRDTFLYDFYHYTDDFRTKYKEKTGNRPMANLVTTWRWEQAERITPEQRRVAGQKLDVYRDWLRTHLHGNGNPIIVLPIMEARPNYRDAPPSSPLEAPGAWDQLWLSPILEAPELTLLIGHVSYRSRITGVNEMLPVGASIVGLPGTDLSLIETAQRVLRYSGRPLCVATGRQMFEEDYEII